MKRLPLSAPRWLSLPLLLAYVVLAAGGSFLHTCHPQDDDQGTCDHQGLSPRSLDPALNRLTLAPAPAATHGGECLACQWATSSRQPAVSPSGAAATALGALYSLPQPLPSYASSASLPSVIRGPPQV